MNSQDPVKLKPIAAEIPPERVGRGMSEPLSEGEVSGRAVVQKLARCGVCEAVQWIFVDPVRYTAYQCNRCGRCVGLCE